MQCTTSRYQSCIYETIKQKKKEQTSHLDQAHNKFSSHNLQNFLFTYNLHCILNLEKKNYI